MGPSSEAGPGLVRDRWLACGHSGEPDAHTAGANAARDALQGRSDAKLLVVFCSEAYDLDALLLGIASKAGATPLVGCSTAGEIATGGPADASLVVVAIGGPGFSVATGVGTSSSGDLRKAATTAVDACMGAVDQRAHSVILLLTDGLGGDQMEVVRGAYAVVGAEIPLVGGCAGDDLKMKETSQVFGGQALRDSVVAAAISSDAPIGIGVEHSWRRVGDPMLVTSSDGNRVQTLDDQPALDVYLRRLDAPAAAHDDGAAFTQFALAHPLGISRRSGEEVRFVAGAGSLCMISEISPRRVGSFEWDIPGDRLRWSDELYRMLGEEPGDEDRTYADYVAHVHPDDRSEFLRRVHTVVSGSDLCEADLCEAEYRVVGGEREVLWVRARSEITRDAGGRPVLMRSTVLDINASKLTEDALWETTARLRLLQAMATAANEASCLEDVLQVAIREICLWTGWVAGHAYLPASAGGDRASAGGDPAGAPGRDAVVPLPIWHLDDAEALGVLAEALAPACVAPAAGVVRQALASRAPAWSGAPGAPGPSDLERAARGLGLGGAFAFPVCVGTQVACILEFFARAPAEPNELLLETISQVATQLSRVAERQRTSRDLTTARDAAMASSRLKSEFLATVSHEIRTPMNGVIGLTGLLLSTDLDERQRQYAEGVQSAGEALLAVINDILDFSKIEAGRLELEVIDFDLVQVVEETAGLVAESAHRKGLELVVSFGPGLPGKVRGDPARLRQVLLNLASNAVKFTSRGEVVVRAHLAEPARAEIAVRFEVVDTGIGITDAGRQRLFEPFSQADASTTRRFGGTGLGLAISRRIVEAMGGELGFDSAAGSGSTFWFTLPLGRQADAGPHDHVAPAVPEGLRVLVVDDNETAGRALSDQLRAWDLSSEIAPDGTDALRALRQGVAAGQPFAVALIDVSLPGLDGVELSQRIAADPALAGTRPVLLTSAPAGGRAGIMSSGAASLPKPVRLSQLSEVLRRAGPLSGATRVPLPLPIAPAADARGHILVVEDNASNQMVAVGILRLLGYRTDVASDGTEALEALGRTDFDAILMDCQMPEMDGFTATAEIRRREGATGRHTPVIATTAGASDSDRERCLAAGMDDFLPKPVRPIDIGTVLDRWVAGTDAGGVASPVGPPDGRPVLDHELLAELRQLAPDGSLLAEIVDAFLDTGPGHLAKLVASVGDGDPTGARQAAHQLRGESAALGAVEVARLCRDLEEQAANRDLDAAPALVGAIKAAYARAGVELREASRIPTMGGSGPAGAGACARVER